MKKAVATLLIMAMSISLLMGCGSSNDGDSNKGNATNNEAGTNITKGPESFCNIENGASYEVIVIPVCGLKIGM